ncbi:uncharacterized protein LOC100853182 [Vitis vinifera]|nr:uncharacterized protein LOC100853182 [Vitis vinifera]|eukprot:XP_019075873.1 PREDICTED: uncharacterized protein LOC100853182 isoform X1 [Vitis vinifera]
MVFLVIDGWFYANITERFTSLAEDLNLQPHSLRVASVECRMTEPPFVPRERLFEKQRFFQSIHKHTYLKGPMDKITSVAIPAALAATSIALIAQGIYNMSHGIGKKE